MSKILVLDGGALCHVSIFSYGSMLRLKQQGKPMSFIPNPDYLYFMSIISTVKKVGINPETDSIVLALDGRSSWRKDFYQPYKQNRKGLRDSHTEINWEKAYGLINDINDRLSKSKYFKVIKIDNIESDDIQAYIAKKYSDREVVLATGDRDIEQLCIFPNVKVFSLNVKMNASRGAYKIVDDPAKVLADKIRKGDVSDNIIVNKEDDTDKDVELRKYIIDLTNLPDFVTAKIAPYVDLSQPTIDSGEPLPFENSLGPKFIASLGREGTLTYEQCKKSQERKEGIKKRKAKQKRELDKEKRINTKKAEQFTLINKGESNAV